MANIVEEKVVAEQSVEDYWTGHNVTLHKTFNSAEDSLAYFQWRNDQYRGYIELMPVDGQHDNVVLDYGCGPGNDLVGFGTYSKVHKLIGMDVSAASLCESELRLKLHNISCELIKLKANQSALPLNDDSIDYIHSSGVLHHTPDILAILKEFKRILRPNGVARVMVYNYNSLWVHLYVAYKKKLVEGLYQDLNIRQAFAKTTDGPDCPISNVYKPEEFIDLCSQAGFETEYLGAAVSIYETSLLQERYAAIMNNDLNAESRRFLLELEFDSNGFPRYKGTFAGVDGCYLLRMK